MSNTRLFLVVLAVFLSRQSLVGSGLAAVGIGTEDWCYEVCNPSADCAMECYQGDPGFLSTCLNYEGGPAGGSCLGFCGDTYCDPYNDEDGANCYSDCGWCGDDICEPIPEMGSCESDCGPHTPSCNECDVGTNDGCSSGQICNAAKCCQDPDIVDPPDPGPPCLSGFCLRQQHCCPGEICSNVTAQFPGVCVPSNPASLCPL
jgi:hypothetical protein